MFLANDDNPAKLERSFRSLLLSYDIVLFASIKLCKAREVCGINIFPFRILIPMHLPITSDRRQATAKRIHDFVAIVPSAAEYKSWSA